MVRHWHHRANKFAQFICTIRMHSNHQIIVYFVFSAWYINFICIYNTDRTMASVCDYVCATTAHVSLLISTYYLNINQHFGCSLFNNECSMSDLQIHADVLYFQIHFFSWASTQHTHMFTQNPQNHHFSRFEFSSMFNSKW